MVINADKLSLLFVTAMLSSELTLTIPLMGSYSAHGLKVPTHIPINVCGNSIKVIGQLNPSFGNNCVNS